MENVVGDVVVAAGCIAYSGPFTPAFRQLLQQEWTALLRDASVLHTPGTSLIGTLQVRHALRLRKSPKLLIDFPQHVIGLSEMLGLSGGLHHATWSCANMGQCFAS